MPRLRLGSRVAAAVLIVIASLCLAAVSAPTSEAAPARGLTLHPNWYWSPPGGATDAELVREVDAAKSMHADVARLVVPWNMLEPTAAGSWNLALRNRIDAATAKLAAVSMKAVLTIVGTPCWASSDPSGCTSEDPAYSLAPGPASKYGAAVRRFVDRWGARTAAVEVWNEPYVPEGFHGTAAQYAGMVNAAAASLATSTWMGDLLAMAQAAGEYPYGSDWLEQLYDAGMDGHDAISLHPYDFEWDQLSFSFTDPRSEESRYASQIDAVRAEMRARGDASSGIWLTEIGMAVCPAEPGCVSTEEQADWLTAMFAEAEKRPYLRGTLVYALRDQADPHTEWGQRFGVLKYDFTERPAAAALRTALATAPVQTDPTVRTLSVQKTGSGTVTGDPVGIDCGATCSTQVEDGTRVTFTATPAEGYAFTGWTGCDSVSEGKCTVRIAGNRNVSAAFTLERTLTVTNLGGGTIASATLGLNCASTCSVTSLDGLSVTLTANPSEGYELESWTGCDSVAAGSCTVSLTSNREPIVSFVSVGTVAVQKNGSGSGSVVSEPEGIDCGSTCSVTAMTGTQFTLTATPAPGSLFTGWSGCDIVNGNQCAIWAGAGTERTVVATFADAEVLTVQKSGEGTVTGPSGINCGTSCSATVSPGTTMTLTATPAAGYVFRSWTGCDSVSGDRCTVTLSSNRTVTATFIRQRTLTVTRDGAGTVTSSPAGINCGSTCSATVDDGAMLTLTATPAAGYAFTGWTGCDQVGGGQCAVWVGSDRTVRATFIAVQTLTVQKTGAGRVTGTAGGIDCGAVCSATLERGTTVTLTATPASGYVFRSWAGCDSVSSDRCTLTLNSDRSPIATFAAVGTLTAQKEGSGTITSSPAGINCGTTCSTTVDDGTMLTLTATPAAGYAFTGWTGCDQVNGDRCAVWVVEDRSAKATFRPLRTLTVQKTGTGTVTGSAGIDCGPTCSATVVEGTELNLTAAPAAGYRFVGWQGCQAVDGNRCTVPMNADRTVAAVFMRLRTLSIQIDGQGTITSSPAGVNCEQSCTATIDDGTSLTLTATPAPGFRFAGWSGCQAADGDRCEATINSDRTIAATFIRVRTLTVATSGEGAVTGSTAGISCGRSCAAVVDDGSVHRLIATPARGHRFTGWSGCSAPNGTECAMTMSEDRTVTAMFAPVDAPETTIVSAKVKRRSSTATFAIAASGGTGRLTYSCKLDGGSFSPCSATKTYRVRRGRHTFQVAATDELGRTDPTPALRRFTIRRK